MNCLFLTGDLGRVRVNRQRVNIAAHQFGGGSIDHPMSFHRRHPLEGVRGDGDVEVAAFTRAGMTGMPGAVIADLEPGRMQRGFQRGAQEFNPRRAHEDSFSNSIPRNSHRMTPSENTM